MAMYVFQLVVFIIRGPHCPSNRWYGYEGGLEFWKILPSKQSHLITSNDPESAGCVDVVCIEKADAKGGVDELR
jgi:hypothetical protein